MIARLKIGTVLLFAVSGYLFGCSEPSSTPTEMQSLEPEEPQLGEVQSTSAPILPREGSNCSNDVEFVEDLTVPDGSIFPPGGLIEKRWSVRNRGTCNWTSDYRLIRLDQDLIQSPFEVALYPARAGAIGVWQVDFIAPAEPGEYMTRWQAMSPSGERFGQEVFMLIQVESAPAQPPE